MNIQKTNEETTYLKQTITHTFKINDKEVRVYDWSIQAEDLCECDVEEDENDFAKLTEEEQEVFAENLGDLVQLSDGETLAIV